MTELKLISPSRNHKIVEHIVAIEKLRHQKIITSDVQPSIFSQIQNIFHFLESIWSARIEWNNTTVSEAIEQKLSENPSKDEQFKEISNIERAIQYIEEHVQPNHIITAHFIREIHSIITEWLTIEWDSEQWRRRTKPVRINGASFIPPDAILVPQLMTELIEFINQSYQAKDQLLMTAIVHHRFTQIHPFNNGNGRTVRLLTHALLLKLWILNQRQFLNPTAVFCINRNSYYEYLGQADLWTDEWMLLWCDYVLGWLLNEMQKMEILLDKKSLIKNILQPTLSDAKERQYVTDLEYKILQRTLLTDDMCIEAKDVKDIFDGKMDQEISRQLRKLREKRLLVPAHGHQRKYVMGINSTNLLRWAIKALKNVWFDAVVDNSIV